MSAPSSPTMNQMGRFARSMSLFKSSWAVIKNDKQLLTLPAISFLVSVVAMLVLAGIGFGIAVALDLESQLEEGVSSPGALVFEIPALLVLYTVLYAIANFFGVALAAGALTSFRGGEPTVAASIGFARARIASIVAFSILQAIVGTVLQVIEERVPLGGKIATWLVGGAWNVATFFVLPIIADSASQIKAIDAVKQSAQLLRKTWGESLIINAGIGLISGIVTFLYVIVGAVVVAGAASASPGAGIAIAIPVLLGLALLILVFTGLAAVAKAAVYFWASTGTVPRAYDSGAIASAVRAK